MWEYFKHAQSSSFSRTNIYFTPDSVWDKNPWAEIKNSKVEVWNPSSADILFLAGMDWLALSEQQRIFPPAPVINLIQHVRHADKKCPLYEFLKYPATRICVSQEVADAINATGQVNGSVLVSPNGIDHSIFPERIKPQEKDIPLLIVGLKEPEMAKQLSDSLLQKNIKSLVITKHLHRYDFLSLLNRANTVVFLPNYKEGFYLPALEAMYFKALVICPDCIGNRTFCINDVTCMLPSYTIQALVSCVEKSFSFSLEKRHNLIEKAYQYALHSSIEKEREYLVSVLEGLFEGVNQP